MNYNKIFSILKNYINEDYIIKEILYNKEIMENRENYNNVLKEFKEKYLIYADGIILKRYNDYYKKVIMYFYYDDYCIKIISKKNNKKTNVIFINEIFIKSSTDILSPHKRTVITFYRDNY